MTAFDWASFLLDWSDELIAIDEGRAAIAGRRQGIGLARPCRGIRRADRHRRDSARASAAALLPGISENLERLAQCRLLLHRLWSTDDIEWFRVRHADWIADWNLGAEHYAARNVAQGIPPAADEQRYLPAALEISDVGDSAIYLLNPLVTGLDGEWEAWFFSNWNPAAVRYP